VNTRLEIVISGSAQPFLLTMSSKGSILEHFRMEQAINEVFAFVNVIGLGYTIFKYYNLLNKAGEGVDHVVHPFLLNAIMLSAKMHFHI
jgi:hypothetical protein